jgi:hypothetical protein
VKPFNGVEYLKYDSLSKTIDRIDLTRKIFNSHLIQSEPRQISFYVDPIADLRLKYTNHQPNIGSLIRGGLTFGASYRNKFYLNTDIFVGRNDRAFTDLDSFSTLKTVPFFGAPMSLNDQSYIYGSISGDLCYKATDHIGFHIGRGKHFFGHGNRSLFLSDNTNSYPYIKASVDIWKIKYIWMAARTRDVRVFNEGMDAQLYDKALFLHYFSLNLSKRINFDFFEAVITNPYDREGRRTGYEAAYFNPVIFYRPVEFYAGTSDNSLLGVGLNIRLFRSLYLYSQFILDDLVISHINDGSGWWGNKYGIQAGMKAYRAFGMEGLFLRGELNMVSPYTYSHGEAYVTTGIANLQYGSYTRSFAHPLGSNFAEGFAEVQYQKDRFFAGISVSLAVKGMDYPGDSIGYGGEINRSYTSRPDDYGVRLLQGLRTDMISIRPGVAYLLNPKWGLTFRVDAEYRALHNETGSTKRFMIMGGVSCLLFNE